MNVHVRKGLIVGIVGVSLACASSSSEPPTPAIAKIKVGTVPAFFGGTTTGQTVQMMVTALDSAGKTINTNLAPTWSISDSTAGRVDQNGLVKSLSDNGFYVRATVQTGNAILSDSFAIFIIKI